MRVSTTSRTPCKHILCAYSLEYVLYVLYCKLFTWGMLLRIHITHLNEKDQEIRIKHMNRLLFAQLFVEAFDLKLEYTVWHSSAYRITYLHGDIFYVFNIRERLLIYNSNGLFSINHHQVHWIINVVLRKENKVLHKWRELDLRASLL